MEKYYFNYTPNDGTVEFYSRIRSFLKKDHIVLDLGAGRAAWLVDDENKIRKGIRLLKGEVFKLVAADIDSAIYENSACDEKVLLKEGAGLPFPDSYFDVIIADYVFEHITDVDNFVSELERVCKKGGLIAARTPHKYMYVSFISRLIGNGFHKQILKLIQPSRKEIDVFPTFYLLNTINKIKLHFINFTNYSFIFRTNPSYYFNSNIIYNFISFFHRVLPKVFSGNIFVFLIKNH